MPKDPIEVVVRGLLTAGQAAGLGSIDRYENDVHYKATIDRTATVAVQALKIEPVGQPTAEGPALYRIRGLGLMRLLLGSGGFRSPERHSLLVESMRKFFGPIERVLFVPYAMADHDAFVDRLTARNYHAGYELESIHRTKDPIAALSKAEGIYVGGGNTFRLLTDLYRHGLVEPIRERVQQGLPYLGISAGTNVACPTIITTNDMAIVLPTTLDALNLVPFQINAHYFSGPTFIQVGDEVQQHFGETRDDRIAEFHELYDTPVIGLREGGLLLVTDGEADLAGASARLFVKGREPVDVGPGSPIWPPPADLAEQSSGDLDSV